VCRLLVDLDEWGQFMWLNLLLRYARTMLSKPSSDSAPDAINNDVDLELLLSSSEPLLHSRNPAVSYWQLMRSVGDLTATGDPCSYPCRLLLKFRLEGCSRDPRALAITGQLFRGRANGVTIPAFRFVQISRKSVPKDCM